MTKRVFEINGHDFDTFEGFYDEIGRKVLDDTSWGRNLDAFNDVLRGGFGTPDDGFVLRWLNSDRSRDVLGYPATIRYLEEKVRRCHPANVDYVRADLESAHRGEGQTLFLFGRRDPRTTARRLLCNFPRNVWLVHPTRLIVVDLFDDLVPATCGDTVSIFDEERMIIEVSRPKLGALVCQPQMNGDFGVEEVRVVWR